MSRKSRKARLHREAIVRRVADVLSIGLPSPFRFESACRAGLRIAYIRQGRTWGQADARAALIVELAFARLGIRRPSWREGQPAEVEISFKFCKRCGKSIEVTRKKFCSDLCSHAASEQRRNAARADEADALAAAYAAARISGHLQRTCQQCGKQFEINRALGRAAMRQKYCSRECALDAKRGRRMRDCDACGRPFIARKVTSRFCSVLCMYGNRRCDQSRAGLPAPDQTSAQVGRD